MLKVLGWKNILEVQVDMKRAGSILVGTKIHVKELFSVVDSEESAPGFLSSEVVHKWDRKRNGSAKVGEKGIKRQETRKDWSSGIVQIVEEIVVARLEHQEKLRSSPGSHEDVSGITNEKANPGHGRRKEKLLSRWDYPEPKLEVVIEASSQAGTGMERIERKWGEPEQDIFNSRALEVEPREFASRE